MPKNRGATASLFFIALGAASIILGLLMFMNRPQTAAIVPENFVRTEGVVVALGNPVVGLPDDAKPGQKPIHLQSVIISYMDGNGSPHHSEGYIAAGSFKVGDRVPVQYDPDNPGTSHRMVSENIMVALWKFLLYAGGLLTLMGYLELQPLPLPQKKQEYKLQMGPEQDQAQTPARRKTDKPGSV